jgi:hypothetical protein
MAGLSPLRLAALLLVAVVGVGCTTLGSLSEIGNDPPVPSEVRKLSAIVAELHLHLRDDTYHHDRARTGGGQNVFALTLWRLERLRARRNRSPEEWENLDIVIEYARARALEFLRRYAMAQEAYLLVANTGSQLADAAAERAEVMKQFARHAGPPELAPQSPEEELDLISSRIRAWEELALEHHGTPFESLAREEAEAWEMLRVDWHERNRDVEEAILACRRLVERHHASKLHARHLIRLGDLHGEAAHAIYLRARAHLAPFDAERYEALLDQAFALYELAGDHPGGAARQEAANKLQALLARHEGLRPHVP